MDHFVLLVANMISAKILAYSRNHRGQYIVSWELEYPRFIHGEFMTHRLFSRNAASSRAIPVKSMIQAVRENPARPIHWGANQPGMQASRELEGDALSSVQRMWEEAAFDAARNAEIMDKYGAHKQIANRILEPFQTMKTVMTATCMDNFFWLRNHEDAQPEIKELARLMWEELQKHGAWPLAAGEWHLPYVARHGRVVDGVPVLSYHPFTEDGCVDTETEYTLEEAIAVSASCCAQVSYRRLDDTLEKAQIIYQRLVDSKPVHASPFEHQATPIKPYTPNDKAYLSSLNNASDPKGWEKGITHVDRAGNFWSGNFIGFIQHRQLLDDHTCWEYKG